MAKDSKKTVEPAAGKPIDGGAATAILDDLGVLRETTAVAEKEKFMPDGQNVDLALQMLRMREQIEAVRQTPEWANVLPYKKEALCAISMFIAEMLGIVPPKGPKTLKEFFGDPKTYGNILGVMRDRTAFSRWVQGERLTEATLHEWLQSQPKTAAAE